MLLVLIKNEQLDLYHYLQNAKEKLYDDINTLFRFRKGFKYVFQWMPCVRYRAIDSLGRTGGASVRMSMSEGTRTERNGSMMHTMIESLDDNNVTKDYISGTAMTHRGFQPVRTSDLREKENCL